ncbi:hypothetical protein A3Q56_00528 [Intoshia linei]|uniref:Uncharacterized protein n=1 Tax=Intoshia linei TaxID=1819745 RepID=A0A177BDL2_9BILA|nr:hypothetical protein A3Q56_00528 [Intoshia linei]
MNLTHNEYEIIMLVIKVLMFLSFAFIFWAVCVIITKKNFSVMLCFTNNIVLCFFITNIWALINFIFTNNMNHAKDNCLSLVTVILYMVIRSCVSASFTFMAISIFLKLVKFEYYNKWCSSTWFVISPLLISTSVIVTVASIETLILLFLLSIKDLCYMPRLLDDFFSIYRPSQNTLLAIKMTLTTPSLSLLMYLFTFLTLITTTITAPMGNRSETLRCFLAAIINCACDAFFLFSYINNYNLILPILVETIVMYITLIVLVLIMVDVKGFMSDVVSKIRLRIIQKKSISDSDVCSNDKYKSIADAVENVSKKS